MTARRLVRFTDTRGVASQVPGHFSIDGDSWFAFAVGVCNQEDPPSKVRGTKGCRW
jgi:hypothetical protein